MPRAARCPARRPKRSGIPSATRKPLAVGLNCALGAQQLRPYVQELARVADTYVCAYPNAGLPNAFGEYDETPEETAAILRSSPHPACSTSSAAAAARRRSTSG